MPESRGRREAAEKKKLTRKAEVDAEREERKRLSPALADRRGWVAPTMIALLLVGVLWLVVWYITASTGVVVPGMSDLGNWNLLVGMVLMGASFGVATLWK